MKGELRRILLVEDDPDIREIAALTLESFGGYEVTACSSGREAVETAPEVGPDLILLDFMMPGMDGAETLARLRSMEEFRSTPVVFLTAKAQDADVQGFLSLGAAGVVTKPFEPAELPDQLLRIWRGFHAASS